MKNKIKNQQVMRPLERYIYHQLDARNIEVIKTELQGIKPTPKSNLKMPMPLRRKRQKGVSFIERAVLVIMIILVSFLVVMAIATISSKAYLSVTSGKNKK